MLSGVLGSSFLLILFGLVVEGRSLDSSNEASQESLPPDTFRKLAQALYQRGDKVENRLSKKIFFNRNITCNDGSPAGYYMRRNSDSKRWVIFLEGGWYCYDNASCESRWMRLRSLMSSERWPSVKTVGGILSSDSKENPYFSDANHVLIPYCSSDSWSGTSLMGETSSRFAFMGAYIVQEVINELVYYEKLLQGTELYLSGSSAGGTGVLINVDSVAETIKRFGRNDLLVRGISDSGWFLDSNPFSPRSDGCDEKGNCSPIGAVRKGTRLWKAKVNSKCRETFGNEISNCFFGYKIYPLIKSPLFIFQWQFDEAQMIADNVGAPVTKAQWNFIHRMGDQLRASFNNVSAVFSPACISHSVLTKSSWVSIEVDGVTLPNAVNCWIKSLSPPFSYSENYNNNNLHLQDHDVKVNVLSPLSKRGISSMLADAPRYVYSTKDRYKKLAGDLIRSVSIPPTEDNVKNSISNRLKSQKKKSSSLTTSSTSSSEKRGKKSLSPRRKRNRSARRRLKRLRQKCKRHNDAACAEFFKPSNSDLIRSLDRRSSKRQGKKVHNRKKNERKHHRKKKQKKRKRRRKKKEEERKRRRRQRKARRQARKLKPRSVLYVPSNGSPLKALHASHKRCSLKHVDNCSWPQCNRSCPKLRNPATGEEMDFLELLKSFGLDMHNVARALGVDFATLKGMDKDVLLHLLTSQPNS